MSDPVSKAEIEDVLSSIRRLVSDDLSSLRRQRKADPEEADRLVLTPAHRVAEKDKAAKAQDDAWQPDAEDAPDLSGIADLDAARRATASETEQAQADLPDDLADIAATSPSMTLEDRIAGLEAALVQAGGEWEPDGSEIEESDATRPLSADTDADFAEAWRREEEQLAAMRAADVAWAAFDTQAEPSDDTFPGAESPAAAAAEDRDDDITDELPDEAVADADEADADEAIEDQASADAAIADEARAPAAADEQDASDEPPAGNETSEQYGAEASAPPETSQAEDAVEVESLAEGDPGNDPGDEPEGEASQAPAGLHLVSDDPDADGRDEAALSCDAPANLAPEEATNVPADDSANGLPDDSAPASRDAAESALEQTGENAFEQAAESATEQDIAGDSTIGQDGADESAVENSAQIASDPAERETDFAAPDDSGAPIGARDALAIEAGRIAPDISAPHFETRRRPDPSAQDATAPESHAPESAQDTDDISTEATEPGSPDSSVPDTGLLDAVEWEEWQPDEDPAPARPAQDTPIDADAAAADAATDEEDDGFNLYAEDDAAVIDEAALRDMVADFVREELQGVLGERITRNVRRLVRREIERALAMRDLK